MALYFKEKHYKVSLREYIYYERACQSVLLLSLKMRFVLFAFNWMLLH